MHILAKALITRICDKYLIACECSVVHFVFQVLVVLINISKYWFGYFFNVYLYNILREKSLAIYFEDSQFR